ncbi:class I adenylate-forming enzyme family protein [Aurantivibrio plasticivorans]
MIPAFGNPSPLLPDILSLHGKWRNNQPAVICEDDSLSWRELMDLTHQFANGVIAKGIQRGDRVGVVMSNGVPMLQVLLGIMSAGAISVPINLSVNSEALVNMMRDANVSAIIVTSDQLFRIDALRQELPASVELFVCDKKLTDEKECDEQPRHWITVEDLCDSQPNSQPDVSIDQDDLLNIIYSSGTTGMPKGIAHTHQARRDWAYDLGIALRYNGGAKTLVTIGLYSNISWIGMLCTLIAGGTLIIHKKFDAKSFLDDVRDRGVTHTAMVPLQFQRVSELMHSQQHDVSSMQAMMCCGSPLHADLKQTLFEQFPCGVIELYGLTEGIITTLEPEQAEGRWSSVGKPLVGTDILIIDDEGNPQSRGVSGEVVSRGRISMAGYYNNPQATNASVYIDTQGVKWLRSGDIGYLDSDGFLFIVDRKKDMILSGGQNIYPQDIEAVLKKHQWVDDVAVIGAKSNRWGETPVALVVAKKPNIDTQSLKNWANQKLGKQQRITDIRVVRELPRNPNGKLLKRELRKEFEDVVYE